MHSDEEIEEKTKNKNKKKKNKKNDIIESHDNEL